METGMSNNQKNDDSSSNIQIPWDNLKQTMSTDTNNSDPPIMKYKSYRFKKNPRREQRSTRGPLQVFSIYPEKGREELHYQNLTNPPLLIKFAVRGLSEEDYNLLRCAYYVDASGLYSAAGMTTVGKTRELLGGALIHSTVTCHSEHLSEYALSVSADIPDLPYVPNLPKDALAQTTAAVFSYFSIGIGIIYIYSILGSDVYHSGDGDNRIVPIIIGV